jgi:hypothetical protein
MGFQGLTGASGADPVNIAGNLPYRDNTGQPPAI